MLPQPADYFFLDFLPGEEVALPSSQSRSGRSLLRLHLFPAPPWSQSFLQSHVARFPPVSAYAPHQREVQRSILRSRPLSNPVLLILHRMHHHHTDHMQWSSTHNGAMSPQAQVEIISCYRPLPITPVLHIMGGGSDCSSPSYSISYSIACFCSQKSSRKMAWILGPLSPT